MVVGASEVFEVSVGVPADEVAGAVETLTGAGAGAGAGAGVGVGDEAGGGEVGAGDVAVGELGAAEVELAGDAGGDFA
ncbi:hypothetical protein D8W71_09160 [Rhodococcus sp. P1Y]|nr:hypothetical protein D8W71_09160 [Rhodococcus sp. P1Y]